MDAYDQLRQRARAKRDKAVNAARSEYRQTVRQIEALRQGLGGDVAAVPVKSGLPIMELVCDVMPRGAWTVADLVDCLKAAEPGRRFHVPSVRVCLPRLAEQGIIRKVRKGADGQVLWSAAGSVTESDPFGAMSLCDLAEKLLAECGPMSDVELVVKMQERGYRADSDPKRLVDSLRKMAKRNPGRFVRGEDERWEVSRTIPP